MRRAWVASYRVDLQIPILSRLVEVNDDFFVGDLQLGQKDVNSLSKGTGMVSVEGDLCGAAIGKGIVTIGDFHRDPQV